MWRWRLNGQHRGVVVKSVSAAEVEEISSQLRKGVRWIPELSDAVCWRAAEPPPWEVNHCSTVAPRAVFLQLPLGLFPEELDPDPGVLSACQIGAKNLPRYSYSSTPTLLLSSCSFLFIVESIDRLGLCCSPSSDSPWNCLN